MFLHFGVEFLEFLFFSLTLERKRVLMFLDIADPSHSTTKSEYGRVWKDASIATIKGGRWPSPPEGLSQVDRKRRSGTREFPALLQSLEHSLGRG